MNIFYIWFSVFYLAGMLNGIVATLIIYKYYEMKKAKNDAATQEIIAEQKAEIKRLRHELE